MTLDALHAHGAGIEKIVVDKGADCLVQVKDNAPALNRCLQRALTRKQDQLQTVEDLDYGHGRIESRKLEMVPISPMETGWPHTHLACRVERERQLLRRGEVVGQTFEQSLYVATFAATTHQPERVLLFIRGHWGIENELHHTKDRSMNEDRCRASESGIGRVMSCLRSLVAQVSRRTPESLGVIRCRFAGKPHLLLKLLTSSSIADWERQHSPYKMA